MSIQYTAGGHTYSASYKELRDTYHEFVIMPDNEFAKRFAEALHFAVFMSWFKELPSDVTLSDTGLIHEMAHILHLGPHKVTEMVANETFRKVRELFKIQLKLD